MPIFSDTARMVLSPTKPENWKGSDRLGKFLGIVASASIAGELVDLGLQAFGKARVFMPFLEHLRLLGDTSAASSVPEALGSAGVTLAKAPAEVAEFVGGIAGGAGDIAALAAGKNETVERAGDILEGAARVAAASGITGLLLAGATPNSRR